MKKILGALSLTALIASAVAPAHGQCLRTYTLNGDFAEGTLFNVNYTTVANQLQMNEVVTTFPTLWVANAGEDTVSKLDVNTGREVGRYRTWFGPSGQNGHYGHLNDPWSGPAPSRTAVDGAGNVYVLNRHFEFGRPSLLLKILATGGIDRNGNSVIDTSSDVNNDGVISGASEILNMADTNNNGVLDASELTDERIEWAMPVGTGNGVGRSLSLDGNGNAWVGLYNARTYYKVSAATGVTLGGPFSVGNHTPYGSLVDANGMLWGASLTTSLLKFNTATSSYVTEFFHGHAPNYGIALGNNRVYLGNNGGSTYIQFDTVTQVFSYPAAGSVAGFGISTDSAGDIFVSDQVGGGAFHGVTKFRPDGSIIWSSPAQAGATSGDQRGAIVDSNGDVWIINRLDHKVSKYNGATGAAMGVFPVGNNPYTYSDASGLALQQSSPSGNWTVVYDTGNANATGATVTWNANVAAGGSLVIETRSANSVAGLGAATFVPISNGGTVGSLGQYVEVRSTFSKTLAQAPSPVLYDLTIQEPDVAPFAMCTFIKKVTAGTVLRLNATDDCDSSPQIYIKDSASAFVAGPFSNNNQIVVRTNPNQAPYQQPMAGYAARIQLKGQPLVYAKDASNNQSAPSNCPATL